MKHLSEVMMKLELLGFKMKSKNRALVRNEVATLGHVASEEDISIDKWKIEEVLK